MDQQKEKYQPKRVKDKPMRGKKGVLIIVAVLLILLAGGYAVLCGTVDTETVLPKTTINGVDISGMTQAEASSALQEDFTSRYRERTLEVTANGESYTVEVGEALGLDCDGIAEEALEQNRSAFLLRGFYLAKAMVAGNQQEVRPTVQDETALEQAVEDSGLMEIDTTVQTTYETKDDKLIFQMGTTGNSVDENGLKEQISEAVNAGDYDSVIECPMLAGTVEPVDLEQVYTEVYQEKKDATLDPENNYEIVESITGVSFDKEAAQKALNTAEEGSQVALDLIYEEPDVSTENLRENLFVDQLASYTTHVGGTSNRKENVRLAAAKCNGQILLAGEVFGYNNTLGERTAENGYKPADAYLNGETVQEYGGGICQVSSTLYAATLYANLEIVERHNHTYASSYIGLGMDATVSWGGPDLQFCNNRKYPIKLEVYYNTSSGNLTVVIWGTKTDDSYVEMESETLETNAFQTVYKEDSSMYVGQSRVAQTGHDGYKVNTYRKVYSGDGELISNDLESYSVYSSYTQIIYNGTKEKPKPVEKPVVTTDDSQKDTTNTAGNTTDTANTTNTANTEDAASKNGSTEQKSSD